MVMKKQWKFKENKRERYRASQRPGRGCLCANGTRLPLRAKDPNGLLRRSTCGGNATVGSRKSRTCRGTRPVMSNTT